MTPEDISINKNILSERETSLSIIPINSIKISNRFRKDLGDVPALAKNISEIGLLHPVVINPNKELICGMRRIAAYELLGSSEIPVNVVNLDEVRRGEYSENTQRKDFSWHEIIEIKKALEPEIKKESEKRMLSGKPSAKFAEGSSNRTDNIVSLNHSENQTRAKVARYVSFHGKKVSHPTLTKAEAVYDAAQKQPNIVSRIWSDLNDEKISPHKAYKQMRNLQRRQELLTEKPAVDLAEGVKLILGDFREKCEDISNDCIHLIFTDPLYGREFLPLYDDLAKVAVRVLTDGGSILTYCGGDLESIYQIIGFMKSRGLTPWWEIPVIHAGPFQRLYAKHVVVTQKPILWFVKGTKRRTFDFIRDSIISQTPDKTLHDYAQSTIEAEHVISRLSVENDVVLDPMMGSGTTGIAALNLKRRFMGIEINPESFELAKVNIAKHHSHYHFLNQKLKQECGSNPKK